MVSRQIITRGSALGAAGIEDVSPHTHDAGDISGTFSFVRILKAVIDGDIRITGTIRSSNFVEGVEGWRLSADGTGQFNGQFFVPDGDEAAPGLSTFGNMDTGLFFGGGIGFTVDGTEAGRVVDGQLRMVAGTEAAPSYSFGAGTVATRDDVVTALSPVAWWRFADTSDETGTGHTLTFAGSPTPGGAAGAWTSDVGTTFDGTDDSASVADEEDVIRDGSDMSWEVWAKPSASASGIDHVFTIIHPTSGHHWALMWDSTNDRFVFHNGIAPYASATAGEYHHVVMTYTAATNITRCYLNGADIGTTDDADIYQPITGADVRIGTRVGSSSLFQGDLSEIAVYPTVLTLAQVNELYHAQTETAQPGIDSGWYFDSDALVASVTGSEVARFSR